MTPDYVWVQYYCILSKNINLSVSNWTKDNRLKCTCYQTKSNLDEPSKANLQNVQGAYSKARNGEMIAIHAENSGARHIIAMTWPGNPIIDITRGQNPIWWSRSKAFYSCFATLLHWSEHFYVDFLSHRTFKEKLHHFEQISCDSKYFSRGSHCSLGMDLNDNKSNVKLIIRTIIHGYLQWQLRACNQTIAISINFDVKDNGIK